MKVRFRSNVIGFVFESIMGDILNIIYEGDDVEKFYTKYEDIEDTCIFTDIEEVNEMFNFEYGIDEYMEIILEEDI